MSKTVKVKVSGNRQAVEQFLVVLETKFTLMLKSKLLLNDEDGVHCFLDPYAVRKAEAPEG